jgi:predicted Kef-type K+ transport protein
MLRDFQRKMFQTTGKVIKNFYVFATFSASNCAKPAVSVSLFFSVNFSFIFAALSFSLCVGKTYSFAIFGQALAGANCKCVWLKALA